MKVFHCWLSSSAIKFNDLVYYKIMEMMYRTKIEQGFFSILHVRYERSSQWKKGGIKRRFFAVIGVKIWNHPHITK